MKTAVAFTASDLNAILAACADLRGQPLADGVDHGRWWEAFIRVAWETGLRQGDMLNLEWGQLDDDGTLRVVQLKDGVEFIGRLSPVTLAAVRAISRAGDQLVFSAERHAVTAEWKALLRRATVERRSLNELRSSVLRRRLAE